MTDYPKNYDASSNDGKWYKYWLDAGTFKADPKSDKPAYSIAMPPPNITGALHMGHALVTTIQDILVRWKRMSGFETLWIPGTDHASIATEMVVEQHLIRTQNKRKRDFSREEFLKHVWQWKNEKQDKIVEQIQKLGASCDWSSIRFTMDEQSNQAVKTAFKKLYDDGLIYRGNYLINWDPITQTALADDEIEHEERDSFLWHIKYQLENSEDFLVIATTRPETMLGDTAIAVNPKDPRYQHYIGQKAILPICNRPIPIIADRLIDIEFGTGAVKITPAHDHNDYQMGITHSLESINILYPNGRLNDAAGKYHNQTIDEARKNIVAELKAIGALVKIEPHKQRIALSYRSKAVIEPYLSKQWFVNMQGFAKKLKKAVEDEEINLIPKSWNSTYFHWIDNLRDWCISRQLWWGHRIPIWYNKQNPENRFCYDGDGIPPQIAHEADLWQQDEDSLDTWFSSALWPFSIMGWPEKTAELSFTPFQFWSPVMIFSFSG